MSGFVQAASAPVFVHRQRRGAELGLLILALFISVAAYAAAGIGVKGKVPPDIFGHGVWLVVIIIGAHLAVRFLAPYADPVLLPIVALLNGFGLAQIHRLDLTTPEGLKTDSTHVANQQMIWMTLGVILFVAVLFFVTDHRNLQRFTYTSGLGAFVLLILPLVPGIGHEINGARIWIRIAGLSFQPGEIAKLLLILCFAGYLSVHRDALALAGKRVIGIDLPRGRDLGPLLMVWVLSIGVLVSQHDLGSSLLFFAIFVVTLYVSTERRGWVIVGGLLFAAGATLSTLLFGHVRERVLVWLHPFDYYDPILTPDQLANTHGVSSYQLINGLFGMAWGGMIGRGWGEGSPRLDLYPKSDMIIPAIGEELGMTALFALLLLFALIVERGLRTAIVARDDFGKLLSVGLATSFAVQVFVVVGGVTKLIPLTGLTTPFISAGGSSLVVNWAMIALMLRISDQSRRPLPTVPTDDELASEETQVVKLDRGSL